MPFPVEYKYIAKAEKELSFKFPKTFIKRMLQNNGGTLQLDKMYFELYPFLDQSSTKRISRTSNHVVLETQNIRKLNHFPNNAVSIGQDGGGNQIVFIEGGNDAIYFWNHENGNLLKIANEIAEIELKVKAIRSNKRNRKNVREKLDSFDKNGFSITDIPKPWKLFKVNAEHYFQLGKNNEVLLHFIPKINTLEWKNADYWKKEWLKKYKDLSLEESTVTYIELEKYNCVVVKSKKWSPVMLWLKSKEETTKWGLAFCTNKARYESDINSLTLLLKKVN